MREVGGARTDLAGADACAGCGLACCTNLPLTLELCELRLLCEDFISAVLHLAEPSSPSQGQSGGCGGGREREEEVVWWMEWIGSASCSGSTRLVQTQIVKMSNISNTQDTKIASLVTVPWLVRRNFDARPENATGPPPTASQKLTGVQLIAVINHWRRSATTFGVQRAASSPDPSSALQCRRAVCRCWEQLSRQRVGPASQPARISELPKLALAIRKPTNRPTEPGPIHRRRQATGPIATVN